MYKRPQTLIKQSALKSSYWVIKHIKCHGCKIYLKKFLELLCSGKEMLANIQLEKGSFKLMAHLIRFILEGIIK